MPKFKIGDCIIYNEAQFTVTYAKRYSAPTRWVYDLANKKDFFEKILEEKLTLFERMN